MKSSHVERNLISTRVEKSIASYLLARLTKRRHPLNGLALLMLKEPKLNFI